jgi:hypothetical protein
VSESTENRMRAPAIFLAWFLILLAPAPAATVDVVVQAGHEGRPASCATLHVTKCNLGASGSGYRERDWTAIVADVATSALRLAGYRVARRPADYRDQDIARAAVFLHFDGARPACASGASVGFPAASEGAYIRRWETRYRAFFPFRFRGENISTNESHYYGFRNVDAHGRAMLIEFGELTCPAQAAWLAPRLHELGMTLASFLIAELRR